MPVWMAARCESAQGRRGYASVVAAVPNPPFLQHLRDIAAGTKRLPDTLARNQHYVPSFLLARWATPQTRECKLFALTVASGEVAQRKPGEVALQKDLYTLDKHEKSVNLVIEAFLSVIEGYAADPIKRLGAVPAAISDDDRATIAFFIALQQGRTPTGLAQHRQVAHAAAEAQLHAFFRDKQRVAARYRETTNANATDDEIRAWAIEQIKAFKQGRRTIELPDEAPFQALLMSVSGVAAAVAQMDWTLLVGRSELVTSDRGLAMWDAHLPASRGNAWESSPAAEATVPIAPSACLKLTPGTGGFAVEEADAATVQALNKRTYGWAEQALFGTSDRAVRAVHHAAMTDPATVPLPRVPIIHKMRAT
ncbi:MAG: DUF4238 domain-containing protein [Actinobacteria bacterium]|nr:MAG: DUF4238 domain-containing protein [Actinomycetota bacterium]